MKYFAFVIAALISPLALAASVTVKSNDAKEALQPLPQKTIGILTDAGFKLKDAGNGVFTVEVKNYHCDYRHRGAWPSEDPVAGVPTTVCRYNSKNVQDTKKGRIFREAYGMDSVLSVLDTEGGVLFTDCGMGYCGTFAKSISCSVDTKIQEFSAGRFACTYTDDL
jgi:hypothetical protein